MAGSRIVYDKDERGVIVGSAVVLDDEETPEGFEDTAEYHTYLPTSTEEPPVEESKLTVWEGVDLSQSVDAIKNTAEQQEGPTDPAALRDSGEIKGKDRATVEGTVRLTEQVVTVDDGSAEHDSSQTVDAVKNANDQQEGQTGEDSVGEDDESKPRSRRGRSN